VTVENETGANCFIPFVSVHVEYNTVWSSL